MTAPSWGQVKELLHQAATLDSEARAKFLDQACASDAALRAELESLLSVGAARAPNFWNRRPQANSSQMARTSMPRAWRPGRSLHNGFGSSVNWAKAGWGRCGSRSK